MFMHLVLKLHPGRGSSTPAQQGGFGELKKKILKDGAGEKKQVTWSPSWLRVAPNRAGRSAKSMLALCSEDSTATLTSRLLNIWSGSWEAEGEEGGSGNEGR